MDVTQRFHLLRQRLALVRATQFNCFATLFAHKTCVRPVTFPKKRDIFLSRRISPSNITRLEMTRQKREYVRKSYLVELVVARKDQVSPDGRRQVLASHLHLGRGRRHDVRLESRHDELGFKRRRPRSAAAVGRLHHVPRISLLLLGALAPLLRVLLVGIGVFSGLTAAHLTQHTPALLSSNRLYRELCLETNVDNCNICVFRAETVTSRAPEVLQNTHLVTRSLPDVLTTQSGQRLLPRALPRTFSGAVSWILITRWSHCLLPLAAAVATARAAVLLVRPVAWRSRPHTGRRCRFGGELVHFL